MVNVIAEVGINFRGSLQIAKELITQAHKAGCWGVKFQFRVIEDFYYSDHEISDAIIRDEIIKNELGYDQLSELKCFANELGVKFGMSFFRTEDLKRYLGALPTPDFLKVPSAECLNVGLVNEMLRHEVPVMLSTGGHELQEVFSTYYETHFADLIVMHCISNYPTELGVQNLSKINSIAEHFCAGYSSHDADFEVCIAAMMLGAKWIERHITPDKAGGGLDDSTSSDPAEFETICRFANQATNIIGRPESAPNQGEILNMQNLGVGLYAKDGFVVGQTLNLTDFHISAPRKGLSVGQFQAQYADKPLKQPIAIGEPISIQHFYDESLSLTNTDIDFARQNLLTIPVRIHDLTVMRNEAPITAFEFHFSYEEMLSEDFFDVINLCKSDERYSIHLPDYIPGNRIFNPISENKDTLQISGRILSRAESLSERLEQLTGVAVPIIGSFSQRETLTHKTFFEQLNERVVKASNQKIYPQWLPVNAWYFGGTIKLDVFCSEQYIEMVEQAEMLLCVDLCHVVLAANSYGKDYKKWVDRLLPYAGHLHLADAIGSDGEGLPLGQGLPLDYGAILKMEPMKVIEVWQGHFNRGQGFKQAIRYLNHEYGRE